MSVNCDTRAELLFNYEVNILREYYQAIKIVLDLICALWWHETRTRQMKHISIVEADASYSQRNSHNIGWLCACENAKTRSLITTVDNMYRKRITAAYWYKG